MDGTCSQNEVRNTIFSQKTTNGRDGLGDLGAYGSVTSKCTVSRLGIM